MRPLCMHYNLPAMSFPFIFHSHSVLRVAVPLSIGLKAGGGTWDRLSVTYCHALMNKFTLFHTLKHPEVPPCWQTAPWATTFSALLNDLGPVVVLMHSPDIRAITYFLFDLIYIFNSASKKSIPKYFRPKSSTLRWIYPVYGIPLEAPVEKSALGVLLCGVGSQLERQMDVLLTGCVPENQDCKGQEGERRFVITLFIQSDWSGNIRKHFERSFFKGLSEWWQSLHLHYIMEERPHNTIK